MERGVLVLAAGEEVRASRRVREHRHVEVCLGIRHREHIELRRSVDIRVGRVLAQGERRGLREWLCRRADGELRGVGRVAAHANLQRLGGCVRRQHHEDVLVVLACLRDEGREASDAVNGTHLRILRDKHVCGALGDAQHELNSNARAGLIRVELVVVLGDSAGQRLAGG